MNYLQAEKISKSFGIRTIFSNLDISIERGQKIALVARNGTGKSTLLNILAGKDLPDSGRVTARNDIKISYLSQDQIYKQGQSVIDYILDSDSEITKVVKQYEDALAKGDESAIESILSDMDRLAAWDYESRVQQVLGKLKITGLETDVSTLSGGQLKRVALAKILLEEPDLYILDEPTNHLDIEMVEWLEDMLNSGTKTILMVTHDRYFLDEVCTDIYELDQNKLFLYHGNYAYFLEKKADREASEKSEYESSQNILRREAEWVRRQPKARTTKSKSRVDAFHELKDKTKRPQDQPKIEMQVKMQHLGNKIVELIKVSKAFGDKIVLDKFSYSFRKGERIAIAGPNGSGKSTLLNMLVGRIPPDSGKIIVGDTIAFGFYEQKGMKFRDDDRVIEHIRKIAEVIETARGEKISASQMLTRFDFPPDRQFTPIANLSGGEKRRLYLLTVLMQNPNFLILDEPTNDLDILTLTRLEDFLQNFPGCLIIVSHDRYFMDKLTEQTFAFQENGHIKVYGGNYTAYRIAAQKDELSKKSEPSEISKVESQPVPKSIRPKTKMSFKEKQELDTLNVQIPQMEARKAELENILAAGLDNAEKLVQTTSELGKLVEELDEKGMRWLELLELAENSIG
jgi:ATP-binding cassette subfamily F protein uup